MVDSRRTLVRTRLFPGTSQGIDKKHLTVQVIELELRFFLRLSRQSFLSEGEFHETRHSSPCGDLRGFFVRVSPFRQSALPLSISDVSFYTQNPFASTDITPLHRYYGFIRLLASLSRLRGLPSSCQNFRHASPGSTPSAPYVLCRSQTHDIGFIQSERLASGSRPSRGFDTRFTCVGTHVFVR